MAMSRTTFERQPTAPAYQTRASGHDGLGRYWYLTRVSGKILCDWMYAWTVSSVVIFLAGNTLPLVPALHVMTNHRTSMPRSSAVRCARSSSSIDSFVSNRMYFQTIWVFDLRARFRSAAAFMNATHLSKRPPIR